MAFAAWSKPWLHALRVLLMRPSLGVEFTFTKQYAAQRGDYYLRRSKKASKPACTRLLRSALDMNQENATILDRARRAGCPLPGASSGASSLQIGPINSWSPSGPPAAECPVQHGVRAKDVFPTPLGFIHASQLNLRDWQKTLRHFKDATLKKFKEIEKKWKSRPFTEKNYKFFVSQTSSVEQAVQRKDGWPEMYGSDEYLEWTRAAKDICVSFARKVGVPLSEEEAKDMYVALWGAVYPKSRKDRSVTHTYHSHAESLLSFTLYVSMPEPTTPLILADPRGLPPIEDYSSKHLSEDLDIDGEPPFHQPIEFYAGEGDIVLFPSYMIHKAPPHIGNGNRVVWAGNCELPRQFEESRIDHWLRFALTRWSAPGWLEIKNARRGAVKAYQAHAEAAFNLFIKASRPHSPHSPGAKRIEVQNQLVAMLQFAPHDAKIWFAAGNLSAHMYMVDIQRPDIMDDAKTFLLRALQLDPSIKSKMKKLIKQLTRKADEDERLEAAYDEIQQLSGLIKHFKEVGDLEMIQFLHSDINGPSKCQRMCLVSAPAVYKEIFAISVFSSRVLIAPRAAHQTEQEAILELAKHHMLGDVASVVEFEARPPCWWRDQSATVAGFLCDTPATVWFADPRGAWPEQWVASVPSGSGAWPQDCAAPLGTEPKAPFHHHVALDCRAGELMLFPAWLAHQVASKPRATVRPFVVKVPLSDGEMAGWTLPVLHPHCRNLREQKEKQERADEKEATRVRNEL